MAAYCTIGKTVEQREKFCDDTYKKVKDLEKKMREKLSKYQTTWLFLPQKRLKGSLYSRTMMALAGLMMNLPHEGPRGRHGRRSLS